MREGVFGEGDVVGACVGEGGEDVGVSASGTVGLNVARRDGEEVC